MEMEATEKTETRDGQFCDRVGRLEFFVKLLIGLGLFLLMMCAIVSFDDGLTRTPSGWIVFPSVVVLIYLSVLWLILASRRLHDLGHTGWWLFGYMIFDNVARNVYGAIPEGVLQTSIGWVWTLIEAAAYLYLLLWPGMKGDNRYGPPAELPKTGPGRIGFVIRNRLRARVISGLAVALLALAGIGISRNVAKFGFRETLSRYTPAENISSDGPASRQGRVVVMQNMREFESDYSRLAGQDMTMTNVLVQFSEELGNGWTELFLNHSISGKVVIVCAYLPTDRIDALPRSPKTGDRFPRLCGRVLNRTMFNEKIGIGLGDRQSVPRCGNSIWLEVTDVEIPWKDQPQPTIDASKATGDELVRFALSLDSDIREDLLSRAIRKVYGRTFSFSECEVSEVALKSDPHIDLVAVAADSGMSGLRFTVPIRDEETQTLARRLLKGMRLKDVRVTACEKTDYDYCNGSFTWSIWMTDLSIGAMEQANRLPDFEADNITGNELIELLRKMGRALSLEEVKELERRLDGQRLRFAPTEIEEREMEVGEHAKTVLAVDANYHEQGLGFSFRVKLKQRTDSGYVRRRQSFSGVVTKPSFWFKDKDADSFVIHLTDGMLH